MDKKLTEYYSHRYIQQHTHSLVTHFPEEMLTTTVLHSNAGVCVYECVHYTVSKNLAKVHFLLNMSAAASVEFTLFILFIFMLSGLVMLYSSVNSVSIGLLNLCSLIIFV